MIELLLLKIKMNFHRIKDFYHKVVKNQFKQIIVNIQELKILSNNKDYQLKLIKNQFKQTIDNIQEIKILSKNKDHYLI